MKVKERRYPLVPNLLTAGNLFCGFLSIIYAINDAMRLANYQDVLHPYILSAWLILIAVVFDMLDGIVARLLKATSNFGIEIDSLADLVSFGIAPSIMVYLYVLRNHEKAGWLIASVFVICGALRLARFNVMTKSKTDSRYFTGMPIPAAAGVLAAYVILSDWGGWYVESGTGNKGIIMDRAIGWYVQHVSTINLYGIPVLMILLSALMVSTIPFPNFKRYAAGERLPAIGLLGCIMIIPFFIWAPQVVVFALLLLYMLFGLITGIVRLDAESRRKIREKKGVLGNVQSKKTDLHI